MNIIVCLKWITCTDSPIRIEGTTVNERGIYHVINPYDLLAVEEALRLKDLHEGSKVTVVCLGPPPAESGIRRCLAMGVDKSVMVWDSVLENADSHTIASILADIIRPLDYDLIICGQKAADIEEGQVGAILAHALNLPVVSSVVKVDCSTENGELIAHRKLLRGDRDIVKTALPVLLTVEVGLNRPRYPAFRSILIAEKREIQKHTLKDLNLNPDELEAKGHKTRIVAHSKSRPKPKKLFTPDSNLSAIERMNLIMSGGVKKKQGNLLEGDTDYITSNTIKFLSEQKLLPDYNE